MKIITALFGKLEKHTYPGLDLKTRAIRLLIRSPIDLSIPGGNINRNIYYS